MYYRNYSYYINMILHNIKYNTGKTLDMTYSTGLKPNECLNSFSFIGVFKIFGGEEVHSKILVTLIVKENYSIYFPSIKDITYF